VRIALDAVYATVGKKPTLFRLLVEAVISGHNEAVPEISAVKLLLLLSRSALEECGGFRNDPILFSRCASLWASAIAGSSLTPNSNSLHSNPRLALTQTPIVCVTATAVRRETTFGEGRYTTVGRNRRRYW
jgi:hypothetical protein